MPAFAVTTSPSYTTQRDTIRRGRRQPVADRFEYRLVLVQTIVLYPRSLAPDGDVPASIAA